MGISLPCASGRPHKFDSRWSYASTLVFAERGEGRLRAFRRSLPHRYARRVARIRVQRPQSVSAAMRPLLGTALITFIALKLAGVVAWSWWWVLSPLWINAAPLVLVAGGLLVLWCLGRLSISWMNPFHWRRRRQARLFLCSEPPPR